MKKKKDVDPINNKGKLHGYQEWYRSNGKIRLRCIMKHNQPHGYEETHKYQRTLFYIR